MASPDVSDLNELAPVHRRRDSQCSDLISLSRELRQALSRASREKRLGAAVVVRLMKDGKSCEDADEPVLREAEGLLEHTLRSGEVFARLTAGEAEWGVVLERLSVREEARLIAERLEALEPGPGYSLKVGFALFPLQGLGADLLWMIARQGVDQRIDGAESPILLAADTLRVGKSA